MTGSVYSKYVLQCFFFLLLLRSISELAFFLCRVCGCVMVISGIFCYSVSGSSINVRLCCVYVWHDRTIESACIVCVCVKGRERERGEEERSTENTDNRFKRSCAALHVCV